MSELLDRISKLSPKRLALLAMDLQSQLDAVQRQRTEPIAIIGMGCRVPGAEDPEAFWRLLRDGVDAVREVPADRWDVDAHYDPDPEAPGRMSTRWGGFLERIDRFDPRFFGIAPRDAVSMDPQHRLMLEVAWEALEDAGQAPRRLAGSPTGVFVGITTSDYARRLGQADLQYLDNYVLTGTSLNFVAGRLSYVLGLQGPSMAVDTACSSSLVAVHLACQSLRSGESGMALAGGVNAILTPHGTIATSKARMLAADGRCKTFDAAADGIVRGEGCGAVILKRLSDARADRDRVLALVRGSAVNQDGASGGLTVPNGQAQQALLRDVLARSGVRPAEVDYVEAHGTGTGLGDPIEVRALAAVLGAGRDRGRPLKIGSVKTNLGHLESASGVVGLIKTVLALQHEEIPPHLHLKNPTPHVDWKSVPVVVPTTRTPWPASGGRRIAGVSSFGFSGTNAHVVLEEAPLPEDAPAGVERPLHVLALSAKSEGALQELVGRLGRHLSEHPTLPLADVCFTANAGRGHFAHRLAVPTASNEDLSRRLSEWASRPESAGALQGHVPGSERPKVAFLFTGQGSQYAGMGRTLFETQPAFRKALERCAEILQGKLERPLLEVMYPAAGHEGLLGETAYTQPALFALEYALVELWRSWGIEPSWVMGHSVGEYAAACVAGVFSLEDALELVATRGRLMQALPVRGAMAAVFGSEEQVAQAIASVGAHVSIAAVNGPASVVISGTSEGVGAVRAALDGRGLKSRPLDVSHAFHSALMDPLRDEFSRAVGGVSRSRPRLGLVSNLTGGLAGPEVVEAEYWSRHLREPVRFMQGMATLREQGCAAFIEIGPLPTLLGMAQRCLPEGDRLWLPSLRRGRDDWSQIVESLGALYVHGAEVDWEGFDRDYRRRKVALPTYPFQRERYWIEETRPPLGDRAAAGADVQDLVYEVKWRERPRGSTGAVRRDGSGRWLVLADDGGVGRDLARRLEERGQSCELVFRTEAERLEEAIHRGTRDGGSWRGVVHLWAVDAPEPSLSSLRSFEEWGFGSAIALVRALAAVQERGTRLWLVTRGAQAAATDVVSLPGAALWGLGRVVALEQSHLWGGLVDLSPSGPVDASDLIEELLAGDGEDQIALREGKRFVARLERGAALADGAVELSGNASYLITGGLGGLGLGLARWMVGRGAKRLYLVGRSEGGSQARDAIAELEGLGARVQVLTADVADAERMQWVLAEAGRESVLKGIVHAAGVMEPRAIAEMGLDDARAVLRPKVLGGWVLHELSAGLDLDFFVTYSSAAGVWGSQGAGHYAAANHFLDALVSYRRAKGLPGLSVSWGPWGGAGMATEESQRWLEQMGVRALSPAQGLDALGRLLATGVGQATVAAVDWSRFRPVFEARASRRLLEKIEVSPAKALRREASSALEKSALLESLAVADSARRRELLVAYLRGQVARVLGLADVGQVEVEPSLTELGLDSLMATQLKNRVDADLEADVAVATFLTGPSIAELARLIDEIRSARDAAGTALLRPVSSGVELPLSFGQQRLWFLDQLDAGVAYTLSWAARVAGPLDTAALEASLDEVVRRHEALRTVFPAVDGRPSQRVQARLRIPLARVDLRGRSAADRARAATEWAAEEAQRPFDLALGPLLRASLLELGEDDHALVLTLHHIVTDGWSMEVLVGELAVLYEAFRRRAPSPLPELPVQYVDYARWQRSWLQGEVLEQQLSQWRRRLAGRLPVLELPTDRPRPPVQTYRGATHTLVFPRSVAGNVLGLGQREGVTLFMTLAAALQALLQRYTGQDDVLIGFSVANRNRAELEGLIGFFINNLVLRTDLSGDPPFRELLARVKERALEAYDHQDVPFEKLVEELHPDRDLAQNPIFQVMLDVQNAARKELRLSGLSLTPLVIDTRAARFDLEIHFWHGGEDLAAVFHYNTDLFDAATIERMATHYQTLLQGAVEDPERRLSELPVLTAAERHHVLAGWNATAREYPRDATLTSLFEAQVERTPETVAVSFEGTRLSYRELNREANRLANYLVSLGVGPEVRVGISVERSLEMVVGLLGILKAGGAYVPIDPTYPEDRLAFMLADADVPVLLTQAHLSAGLPAHRARVIHLDRPDDAIAHASDANPGICVDPSTLAYVIYTSGSTGRPKGAMNSHAGICNRIFWGQEEYGLTESDRVLQKTPFSFDISVWEFFWPLMVGARLVVAKPGGHQEPAYLARVVREEGITTIHFVPSMLRAFLDEPAVSQLTSLRRVICSGEALSFELQERFFSLVDAPLIDLYGPTEAAVEVTRWDCRRGDPRAIVPIGAPIANTQAYVLDPSMSPVPPGVTGELFIGGVQVGRGYHKRPDLTAERFVPNPFSSEPGQRLYRTGDLVRHLADGQIEFLGRMDHQVKVRGFRIELGEIESALGQHPGVREAVLLARTDERGDARLVAYVVPSAGITLAAAELRGFLKERLPEYMVPPVFVFLETLPLTPNGKVDRRALPTPETSPVGEAYEGPRTRVEEVLARIWSEVLRVEVVGIRDNFFELGGDSILSLQVMARATEAGLRLSLKQLFQHQTVAELALVAGTAAEVEAEQGLVTGAVPLTPIQRWFFEQERDSAQHFNQAVLLEVRREVAPEVLESALVALESHHDALRMRYAHGPSGWEQTCEAPGVEVPFRRADLRGREAAEQKRAVEQMADEAQRSLDLVRGPLWRAVWFEVGEGRAPRLLVVVHHLIVDGVSWRVLLEDLQAACAQLSRGERVRLPRKTTSFKRWSERLARYARSAGPEAEREYWRGVVDAPSGRLPVDHDGEDARNTGATSRTVSVALDEAETRALLQEAPAAYRTHIDDLLLTALVEAFAPWTGRRDLLVELEGHGREDLFEGVDLSRTVGWFTTLYPVRLERVPGGPGDALKGIKEQLRQVPNRGIGYGLLRYLSGEDLRSGAEVAFNYLGQFDQLGGEDGLFAPAAESSGRSQGERARRTHLIEVAGLVMGGRLHVDWVYSEAVHERQTVEALARRFEGALRELIAHCRSGAWGFTPSDFPLARLDAAGLERAVGARRDVEDIYPLSPVQEGMLLHTLMAPASGVYVEQGTFDLEGALDGDALRRAWERVLERHGALRTRFAWEGMERPLQVVERGVALPWEEHDWKRLSAEEQEARFEELSLEDQRRGFDLGGAPLMRLELVRLGEKAHRLMWSFHHAVLDGWCLPLLMKEVLGLYQSYTGGAAAELAEVRPYRQYIAWLQGQDEAAAERYWREALSGFTVPTPLVVDHPSRGDGGTVEAGERTFALGEAATKALKAFGRRHGLTLNTLVQGAWAVLLSRYSGERDVVFGVTASGRPDSLRGVETMVGLFINTLPLRVDVAGDRPLVEWLKSIQARQVEQRQWEHSPLAQVQKWSPVPAGRALFESLLVFENYPVDPALWAVGLEPRVTRIRFKEKTNYPLSLVAAAGPRLFLRLVYERERFDEEAMARLEGHLAQILESMAAEASRRVCDLPLLAPGERHRIVTVWNQTDTNYPGDAGIHELFEIQAAKTPDVVALSFGAEELTYGELNARANRLAHHLRRHGVRLETRVGICTERSPEMVVGLLGILKAGGVYVPLDPSYPKERLAFMLEDSQVPVLVTQERMLDALPPHRARVVCLDRDREQLAAESDANPTSGAGGASLAYVIYTSGSTGIPKGVAIPHRAVSRLVLHTDYVQLQPSDRVAQASNASFDAATFEIWGALLTGARLVGISREVTLSPRDLAQELRRREVTALFLTTALFNQVAREEPQAFSSLRHLLFGGEAVDPARVRDVRRTGSVGRLLHVYGPTETTTFATWHLVEDVPEGSTTVPIGRPIANTRMYVLDRHLDPVPVGVSGELFLGGDGLARGYLGRPELTAEKFVPDPFSVEGGQRLYRTGDLVRQRPDGAIEFLGRVDHQVKLRGFRIELGEIESMLARQGAVRDAVVLLREDEPGDKRLVAYLVRKGATRPAVAELREFLAEALPEYMVPSAFVFLEALPLNANGKVDRGALPAPEARAHTQDGLVAPRNDLEREIAGIWREALHLDQVGVDDNFFDLGGHSLTLLRVHGKLRASLGAEVGIVDLFEYPTVGALAAHLQAKSGDPSSPATLARTVHKAETARDGDDDAIAIVGMAGRFPGARDVEEFWRNLRDGVESISFFTSEELEAEGIPAASYSRPEYVRARGVVADADLFDASFFGYTAREAEIMDPQQRVFLETAWSALETAGYDPTRYPGRIGVYAGTSLNAYVYNVISNPEAVRSLGGLAALIASDKDFLTTRVSYKLDLRGPSVSVQTACSTSLVAVHLACRSLVHRECDIGLAGGVSIGVPQRAGYLYEEEGILSPDGHCRAFDRAARGTVTGSGVGIVVLKRLADAIAEGDVIQAVIKGSAINNDGAAKVGYTAPGIQGQAEVITAAQQMAGIHPDTIGYLEAHGTGTTLGDPIEIQALTRVFGSGLGRRTPCLIGSVKTNVGHLDAAAGVTGLIKAALAVQHGQIPPSLHFEEPNPKIDFASGPFRVSAELAEWSREDTPRRAAVSSFGIGGTNAHVVVEEPPAPPVAAPSPRTWQLLVLSARTTTALDEATANLAAHLADHPEIDLADAAYTLQVGRRAFRHRRIAVCRDGDDARGALESGSSRLLDGEAERTAHGVAFVFPGQGAQYVGMGRGLYESEESFRADIDRCAAALGGELGFDLRDVLYPEDGTEGEAARRLDETAVAQPALFAFEYALARLWMSWGVKPAALLGHSIGEYVAACLAGVFSLEDALALVAARGRLMQGLPPGSMLAVALPEPEVQALLDGSLGLAALNGPSQCVVSGPHDALQTLEERLLARGVDCHRLRTSHAFHSPMMEPVLAAFRERVAAVKRQAPTVRYVSNLTGTWITDEQAVDPGYWARHLRETVRLADGLGEVLKEAGVVLEVGPGHGLSSLARQRRDGGREPIAIASTRHLRESRPDQEVLLTALGRLWLAGVDVDWAGFHAGEARRRVVLPTYPFERQRYWIDARPASLAGASSAPGVPGKKADIADWFYRPVWSSAGIAEGPRPGDGDATWMVFLDECGLGNRFRQALEAAGSRVIAVEAGDRFERRGEGEYAIRPAEAADYEAVFAQLRADGSVPQRIVHAWGVTARHAPPAPDRAQDLGFYSLVFLAQALGNGDRPAQVGITVLTSGMQAVGGEALACPEKATVLGPCRVIPQEYAALRCRSLDLIVPASGAWRDDEIDRLLADCADPEGDAAVAYRGGERWVQGFEPFRLDDRTRGIALRERGVYLITGGLGGIGLELASFLAESVHARLVLVGRTAVPPREEWDALLRAHDPSHKASRQIRKLQAIEAGGGEVLVLQADVSDRAQMRSALARAESRFGAIQGVIHSAGVAPGGVIQLKTRDMAERVLAPKVTGTVVLAELFADRPPDFMVLCSSLASVLGVPGQADYCAANAFQDAFARRQADAGGPFVVSLNWDTWLETGMAVEGDGRRDLRAREEERRGEGILSAQGAELFARSLRQPLPQLAISTVELGPRLAASRPSSAAPAAAAEPRSRHRRPDLAAAYAAPRDEVEEIVARLWQELLGFERVGVDDNFFDLGGHSLLATQMTNWLRQTFQVPVKLQDVFEGPTVAELARAIVRSEGQPGQVREIARLALSLEGLSDSEVERMLAEPRASGDYVR